MKGKTLAHCVDRYIWSLESDEIFSVASIRKFIDNKRFQEVGTTTRWIKSVSSKINIVAWKIKCNALPTRFNLSRRGMEIDSLTCPVCKSGVETSNHLFFQCSMAKQLLCKVAAWGNVIFVEVNSYKE